MAVGIILAILGAAVSVAGYTPNKPGSNVQYPFNAPYSQAFEDGYSPIKYMGGFGPYSNRQAYGISRNPPEGCEVDQVIMVKRHGERYSMGGDTDGMKQSLAKMRSKVSTFKDDLEFLNRWEFFVPESYAGLETFSGPYNGLLESYKHGAEYRVRYGHLWEDQPGSIVPIWASANQRVVQTARKFGEGFFAWNYTYSVALNVISEDDSMGANSLTPSCPADDNNTICNNLPSTLPQYDNAAMRLNKQNPGMNLNSSDIVWLMQIAAIELNARGYSPWVEVFTMDEWLAYSYISELGYYYCHGPADKNSLVLGSIYTNATLALMNEGPDKAGKIFFSFTHDNNITPILAALGISTPSKHLPVDYIPFPNEYNIGDIMPMGARLTIERMSCNASMHSPKDTFVRLILNEAVVPFKGCQEGPGFSCALSNYTKIVSSNIPDYATACKVNATTPHYLSFFWDWATTTTYNHQTSPVIPYQGGDGVV